MTLTSIHTTFAKWLSLPSTDAIDVMAAAVVANRLEGPPLFLVFVGPSGSGKSEFVESLRDLRGIRPLGKITPKTFMSGMKGDTEGSLLMRLPKGEVTILTLKDMTTIFSMRSEERSELMSQFREIYDGRYVADWGTSKERIWEGKIGLIGACTGIYDEVARNLSTLGERFLVYRAPTTNPVVLAERAMRGTSQDPQMKHELAQAMCALDDIELPSDPPYLSYDVRRYLSELCAFLSRLRTQVPRDRYSNITGLPEIESTGRLAKQFAQLARGLTIVRDLPHGPTDAEIRILERVAISSAPATRVKMLTVLPWEGLTIDKVSAYTGIPKSIVHRTLEDLCLLGITVLDQSYRPNPAHGLFIEGLKEAATNLT